jgi:hypothetical protein
MSGRITVTLAALMFWLIPAVAPAAPLFPMQLGAYNQYDGSDLSGHTWQASIWVVAQNINLNSQTYFHIRRQNWNPYGWNPRGAEDALIRSTDVDAFMSIGGPEWRQFSTTGTPTSWQYDDPPGQAQTFTQVEVTGPIGITVPYGSFAQAYENKFIYNEVSPPHQSNPWFAYLVPSLGLIKEVQTDIPPGSTTMTQALRTAGAKPVFLFPLRTGMRLIYDASDKTGHKWQMIWQVQEQVTLNDGLTYFHMRQIDYDPIAGGVNEEFYLRSTASQTYGRRLDDNSAHLEWQAAGPGTAWNFPKTPDTIYKRINSLTPIIVLGGSYLAYVTQLSLASSFPQATSIYDYVVPGLGPVYMEDYINDPAGTRAPLIYTLIKITQGGVGPAVDLLLMD